MCTYVVFFLLWALGTPWENYSAAFPKKVHQCGSLVRTLHPDTV